MCHVPSWTTGLQQQRRRQRNVIQKLSGPLSFVQLLQPRQRAVEGQPRQRRHWIATTAQTANNVIQRRIALCLAQLGPRPLPWTNDDKEPSKDNHYNDVTGLQQQRRRQRNVIQRRTGFFVMCFLGAPALRDKSDGLQQTRWIKCYSERGFATVKTDLGLRTIWKTAMA